jgi:hypothetical protein
MAANPTDGEKAGSKQMAGIISRRQQYRAVKGENFYFTIRDTLKDLKNFLATLKPSGTQNVRYTRNAVIVYDHVAVLFKTYILVIIFFNYKWTGSNNVSVGCTL